MHTGRFREGRLSLVKLCLLKDVLDEHMNQFTPQPRAVLRWPAGVVRRRRGEVPSQGASPPPVRFSPPLPRATRSSASPAVGKFGPRYHVGDTITCQLSDRHWV